VSHERPSQSYQAPQTAREVSALLSEIYGQDPASSTGVIHPAAAARASDGDLHVLRIGPYAPKSPHDFFLLQAVRARADVILTSSANLRAEPDLVHDFVGDSAHALADYRAQVVLKARPPLVFILTQSGDLPGRHPVWSDASDKHVLAPSQALSRVRSRVPADTVVHALDDLNLRVAVALARSMGHRTLSIEAGPSLSRSCYGADSVVDELCLSICHQRDLAPAALGGALPPDHVLFAGRSLAGAVFEIEDWSFARYL